MYIHLYISKCNQFSQFQLFFLIVINILTGKSCFIASRLQKNISIILKNNILLIYPPTLVCLINNNMPARARRT